MKFVPKAPREGINVSKTHPLKEAGLLIGGICGVLVLGFIFLALSVDVLVRFISPELEAEVFSSMDFSGAGGEVADERTAKVQALLDRLVEHWDDAPYSFRAHVVTGEANAAALPGGTILVTTGLLDQLESENELAFVLGHELGHFKNRDHLRRLGREVVYGLAFATLAGVGGDSLPDLATLSRELTARGFDRSQESDADHFGLDLVFKEYAHVGSAWEFFERLATKDLAVDALIVYLSTHPASTARIEELKEWARGMGWAQEGPVEPF
jgi:predicted Zn-dependent protease